MRILDIDPVLYTDPRVHVTSTDDEREKAHSKGVRRIWQGVRGPSPNEGEFEAHKHQLGHCRCHDPGADMRRLQTAREEPQVRRTQHRTDPVCRPGLELDMRPEVDGKSDMI